MCVLNEQWTINLQFLEISDCYSNILASKSRFAVTKLSKAQRMMMKSSSRCSSYSQMKSDYDGDIDRFSSKEWLSTFFPTRIRIHSYNRNEYRHYFELLKKIDKLPLRKNDSNESKKFQNFETVLYDDNDLNQESLIYTKTVEN